MKKIFTSLFALMCMFAVSQMANAGLTYTVVVPTPTYEVYLAGSFSVDEWAPSKRKMTKVDDTHYTMTVEEGNETVKYKYCSGPDWPYVMKDKDGKDVDDLVWDGVQDTVAKWAAVYNPNVLPIVSDIVLEAFVSKDVTELYVTGSFNSWKSPGADGTKMNFIAAESGVEGNLFRDTIHTDNAASLAYKFAAGPSWSYEQTAGDWKLSDPNLTYVTHDDLTFKRIYPGAANLKTVTVNVTAPEGTQSLYMMGSQWGWDGASWFPGTKNTDGTFTFSVPNVDFFQYKYWRGRDWKYEEKQADGTSNLASDRAIDAQVSLTYTDVIASWDASWNADVTPVKNLTFDNTNGDATVVGTPAFAAGKFGQAYAGATDSYLRLPIDSMGEFTATFWYKINATPDRAGILTMGSDSLENRNHGFRLFREGSATVQRIKANVGYGTGESGNDGHDVTVTTDWVHVAFVIANGEQRIYINGVLGSINNATSLVAPMAKKMSWKVVKYIDIASGGSTFSYWNHKSDLSLIDDLKIFDVALSEKQVNNVMNIKTALFNPSQDVLKGASFNNGELRINNYAGIVRLFDLTGKMLLNKTTENGVMQLDLNKGIYILNTTEGNMKLIVK